MTYCNRILMVVLMLGCFGPANAQISASETTPQDILKAIQTSPEPFLLYQQAYPSFVFSSSTQLKPTDQSQSYIINQATSVIEVLDKTYKRIDRKPFAPLPSIEIIENQGIQYLKPHQESTYYQIKSNPQRKRLEKTIYTEALDFYDLPALMATTPSTKDGKLCYSQNQATLCFDSITQLPVSGQVRKAHDGQTILTMVFQLDIGEKNIKVQKPTQVHALRKHTNF